MRSIVLLAPLILVVISLVGSDLIYSAPNTARSTTVMTESSTRFSSAYTTLAKCGSGMSKKQEKAAEQQGSDIPTRCKGPGGYDVFISYSACASMFTLEKGEESISLGMQAVDWKQKTVEWRLANGKPFAFIMRVYEYAGDDHCPTGGKTVGESLIVRGLKGYEQINEKIEVKSTPTPNAKARQVADDAYKKAR